jgi:hypothetical protein
MMARGATVVLDVHAHTLLARRPRCRLPAATLDVRARGARDLRDRLTRTERAHALHTRGLRKFGAPELVALCGQDDAALVGNVIRRSSPPRSPPAAELEPAPRISVAPAPRPGGSSTIATASPSCCSSTTARGSWSTPTAATWSAPRPGLGRAAVE